jgi:hypothetical protein
MNKTFNFEFVVNENIDEGEVYLIPSLPEGYKKDDETIYQARLRHISEFPEYYGKIETKVEKQWKKPNC